MKSSGKNNYTLIIAGSPTWRKGTFEVNNIERINCAFSGVKLAGAREVKARTDCCDSVGLSVT